jgi:ribonuclease HI
MVYIMEFYVDGGCRGNGRPGAIGAAAAVLKPKYGKHKAWTFRLPSRPTPTNQRAEITAIVLALELALLKYRKLDTDPYINVRIHSDSRYAVDCMTKWVLKWANNGWMNAQGFEVANRDLIEKAMRHEGKVRDKGEVSYYWIPRGENSEADDYCNDALDDQE